MQIVSSKWKFYLNYYNVLCSAQVHNTAHEFRISLLDPSYVPDSANHKYWEDVLSYEVTGYTYPQNGITLSYKRFTLNEIEESYHWSANDVVFYLGGVVDVKYMVIYNNTVVTKPLVCWAYLDASALTISGANFEVNIGDIYKITSGDE